MTIWRLLLPAASLGAMLTLTVAPPSASATTAPNGPRAEISDCSDPEGDSGDVDYECDGGSEECDESYDIYTLCLRRIPWVCENPGGGFVWRNGPPTSPAPETSESSAHMISRTIQSKDDDSYYICEYVEDYEEQCTVGFWLSHCGRNPSNGG